MLKPTKLKLMKFAFLLFTISVLFTSHAVAQEDLAQGSLNKPANVEHFRDLGFGLFIHWSLDSQVGTVISHSLVDASPQYQDRFFNDLPKTFYPYKFNANALAGLAKIAGVRYMVFTTKHHSGFAMWDTATTPFNIAKTPFHRDLAAELYTAFRAQGISTGVYFSPDDFRYLYDHHIPIARSVPSVLFAANPGLLAYDQAQLRELMTHYGPIDYTFFDGEYKGLRELAWQLQPDTVVTRGALQTPEQYVPGAPLPGAWESNLTMGTSWGYQPQHEIYKSGPELLHLLFQTRARGGNLLLNVGPKPDGELPIEQEERLREIGLWMMVNSDCIYNVRPWIITNERNLWFTRNADTLYAIVDPITADVTTRAAAVTAADANKPVDDPWKRGTWRDFVLKSVRATPETKVDLLGQNSLIYEYEKTDPRPIFSQRPDGLHIHAFRTQRLQDNSAWPNAAVLRITHVQPAFTPPTVHTLAPTRTAAGYVLNGSWQSPDPDNTPMQAGFEYRSTSGEDKNARTAPWQSLPLATITRPGPFTTTTTLFTPGTAYEIRAVLKHPLLTLYGEQIQIPAAP